MKNYLTLLEDILARGQDLPDRTGVGTRNLFGYQMRFSLAEGFPLMTTKKLHLRSIVYELLWFLSGSCNVKFLNDHKVKIWDAWADERGELGPIYGHQWRSWPRKDGGSIDQISIMIDEIKNNPHSRRLVVSAWNVDDLDKMALAPCHCLFQFFVAEGKLSCQLYQRSADAFLGVPFNIASYALLTHMVAQQCQLDVGDFIWTGGVTHLYHNHLEQARKQIQRKPRQKPRLVMKRIPGSIFDYAYDDFSFVGYDPHPHIKASVAV